MTTEKRKLTDAFVRSIEPANTQSEMVIWDTEVTGFGLRVRGQSVSYIVLYRPVGQGRAANAKRFKIGSPSSIANVKDARRMALAVLGKVASGEDPNAERAEEKRRARSTVKEMLDRYDQHLERREYVTRTDVISLLRRRLRPMFGREISEIKAWEYAEIIERLDKKSGGTAGGTFRTRCSTFLNWCTFDARVLEVNPLAGYRRRRDTRSERVKKSEMGRALSDEELRAIWLSADPKTSFGRLVRFLILTGCRRNEGAKLLWSMVDLDAGKIELPATFTKQARGHTVYTSNELAEMLVPLKEERIVSDFVFPSVRTGGPMSGWSKIMDPSDKRTAGGAKPGTPGFVKNCGVQFTFHDLRRTFRTGLSRLRIETEIAELALGHARSDLESRYNRDDCEAGLRNAFQIWGNHVASLCHEN
ncbi:tyrosine-type recombinase/integrase [Ruegeria conchae]|uniref:Uncharacterized protein DUF4102 n=1 Tax=Ruegeria conchae TaxID=981384 RepID=A0A497ZFQ7_9RHOB|nr:site-specific integrase [Ruegeria conchae]RLK07411.1 uncharacterized protein DUF4102 [Ruegeria conchae]